MHATYGLSFMLIKVEMLPIFSVELDHSNEITTQFNFSLE